MGSVSNHGGCVQDDTPGTAEALPLIREHVGDYVTQAVDGGVRTGYDVLKIPALGADTVLPGRDIIRSAAGGGALGVRLERVCTMLKKAMTGITSVNTVSSDILC